MSFSQIAGTSVIPTLSRLVLAGAFLFAGWNKCFEDATFTADEAAILQGMNLDVRPVGDTVAFGRQGQVRLAAFRQDSEPTETGRLRPPSQQQPPPPEEPAPAEADDPAQPPPAEPEQPPATPPAEPEQPPATPPAEPEQPPAQPETQPPVQTPPTEPADAAQDTSQEVPAATEPQEIEPPADGTYEALGMHKITVLLHNRGWTSPEWLPKIMAIVAAATEFVGAAMLLIGLFSRLWGLGLAILMGFAFYLTSFDALLGAGGPFALAADPATFTRICAQLGLFVLAFGVLLTGPGPLSLDRAIFRSKPKEDLLTDQIII